MMVSSYQDLKAWQVAMDIAEEIYLASRGLPKHELYGLSSQMQRAAVSIPSNLAEGHARSSSKEYLNHISIALGSLVELETQVILAKRLQYLNSSSAEACLQCLDELGKMIRGLQKSLKSKLSNP
jgi:four helix bundle protein